MERRARSVRNEARSVRRRNIVRRLAAMPFLDRLEMVAVSGGSRGAVYEAVRKLESGRPDSLSSTMPRRSSPPTRRYCLTAAGLHRLARDESMTVDELLDEVPRLRAGAARPHGAPRRRSRRLPTRVHRNFERGISPSASAGIRAMPMDAAMTLPDGRTVAVVRQGLTADRTPFSKRLWRLRETFRPSAVLMLMPDEVRLRHARRLMAGAPSIAFLALERDAASAGANAPSGVRRQDRRSSTSGPHCRTRGGAEHGRPRSRRRRSSCPVRLSFEGPEHEFPGWMLPALLKPAEKRALDLLSDWPWIAPAHLGELLGVKRSMLSRILVRLQGLGLAVYLHNRGRPTPCYRRPGAGLARPVGTGPRWARRGQRWSVTAADPEIPLDWRNVSGRRSRQLLRNIEHTEAVHWFVAVLERQAHSRSREIVQLDPPSRASRYFRHDGRLRSIHPDAYGVLRRGANTWPFLPGVGTPSRAARDDGRPHRPLPTLLLVP